MKTTRHTGLMAAALLLAAAGSRIAGGSAAGVDIATRSPRVERVFDGGASASTISRKRGPGWTHAQVQRMAKKRRNVLRNRRAHRG